MARCYTQICCFFSLLVAVYSLPQQSFLAPLNDANVAASQVIFSSGFFPEQPSREAVGGAFSVSNGDDDTNIDDEVATLEGSGTVDNKDDDENLGHIMRGSYAYVGADGLPYMVDWVADEEGFHPSAPKLSNYVELVSDNPNDIVETDTEVVDASDDTLSDESSFDEIFSHDLTEDEISLSDVKEDYDENLEGST